MRRLPLIAILSLVAAPAAAGGFNVVYLVPAYVTCPGPNVCGAPQKESSFTFDTATLRNARSKYLDPKKPALIVDIKGVKDASGAPVSGGGFTVRVTSGQVNLVSLATTLPAGHPLAQQPPYALPLTNGKGHLSYTPTQAPPSGTVVEGGAVTIYDRAGKRLAVVGTQAK